MREPRLSGLPEPRIDVRPQGEALRLTIREPCLSFTHSFHLSQSLQHLSEGYSHLVIDLSCVHYLDNFGFEELLTVVRQTTGRVRFRGVHRSVSSLFELAQLHYLLAEDEVSSESDRALLPKNSDAP